MSIYINGIKMNDLTFNNTNVNQAYFNNNLIWERHSVPSTWEDCSWNDLYNMCQWIQEGTLAEFPSYISLGINKDWEFNDNPLYCYWDSSSQRTAKAFLIGINQDGNGTLTFQLEPSKLGSIGNTGYVMYDLDDNYDLSNFDNWGNTTIRNMLVNTTYNVSVNKNFIKDKTIQYRKGSNGSNYNSYTEKMWIRSGIYEQDIIYHCPTFISYPSAQHSVWCGGSGYNSTNNKLYIYNGYFTNNQYFRSISGTLLTETSLPLLWDGGSGWSYDIGVYAPYISPCFVIG